MKVADLLVTISANSQGLRKELNAVKRNIKSAFGAESIKLSEQVASKFKWIAAGAAALGIASVKMNADMEMTTRAFEVLTGSSDRAKDHLAQLERFAATTPFEFPGLVEASKKLQAYGFQTEAVIPIMEAIGNAAMAVGLGQEGIDRITLALGQMNAKGKVSAEEMRQLAETGLPAWELLAKGIGVSVPEAMDKARKSAISAKDGISALLMGLNSRFNGMMDKVSGEIPQSFSNMQDSVKSIMRTVGASITEAFDLKTKMKNAADWMSEFATLAKSSGIREAFDQMVPDSLKTAIVGISAAIVGVAVPAFALLAVNVIAATWPLLAIGVAFGTAAALIYSNWDSVGPYFTALWNGITGLFSWAWNIISVVVEKIANAAGWVATKVGGLIKSAVALAGIEIDDKKQKISVDTKQVKKAESAVWSLQKACDSLNSSGGVSKGTNSAAKKAQKAAEAAAKKRQREYDQLVEKAKDTSDRIEDEWIQMTGTKMDVLHKWYADEIKTLGETKSVNTNYQRDLTRLEETYSEKRRQILNDEAKEKQRTMQEIANDYSDIQKELHSGGLRGSQKDIFDMDTGAADDIKSVTDFFARITSEYSDATDTHKQDIIDALNATGVAYKVTAQGNLDFQTALNDYELERFKQLQDEKLDYYRQCKDIQAEIDEAYKQSSLEKLQEALSSENVMRLNNYDAMQSMMETYEEARRASLSTTAQMWADVYSTAFDGISSSISDVIMGVSTAEDALISFGKSLLQVIVDFYAKKVAGILMEGIIGKSAIAAQTAASIAAATATAAAWAPAAAAVSLATFGANSAPAMAGISATHALSQGLSVIPFAEGGYVTGPTLAMVGEGRYNESVVQDSSSAYRRIAEGISKEATQDSATTPSITVNLSAMDSKSLEAWLDETGGRSLEKYFKRRGREFAMLGGMA